MLKKYFYTLWVAAAAFALAACSETEGTNPGTEADPVVTVYQYEPGEGYNADNDIALRFVANGKVSEFYFYNELKENKEAYIAANGEQAYADQVVANGTHVDVSDTDYETTLTDMEGLYAITVVAVGNNGQKAVYENTFQGLAWEDVVSGTYQFGILGSMGLSSSPTVLQRCTTDETLYRFKDVFKEGYSLKFTLLPEYTGKDNDGTYTFCRVATQQTGLVYGDYGVINVRDIGYWQGDDEYVLSYGFESGMYEDYSAFFMLQFYISAGSLGYNNYDIFIPNE